jgi:hypothetical protein
MIANAQPSRQKSSSLAAAWTEHRLALVGGAFVLIVFLWFVTHGSWRLFEAESFGLFYDAQAEGILHGRLDVPARVISGEEFRVNGKLYGYFGITPSLFRLPALLLFPQSEGMWSRIYMTMACLTWLATSYLLLITVGRHYFPKADLVKRRRAYGLFLVLLGLGTPTIFLGCRAFIYHEATMWANVLALLYYYLILRYLRRAKIVYLVTAVSLSILCVLARASVGLGTLCTSSLLIVGLIVKTLSEARSATGGPGSPLAGSSFRTARWSVLILGGGIGAALGAYILINWLKFGTILNGTPMEYYGQWIDQPEVARLVGPTLFHRENLGLNLSAYLAHCGLATCPDFPWIRMADAPLIPLAQYHLASEPFVGLFYCMPVFCLLSIVGIGTILRGESRGIRLVLVPLLGALCGWLPILGTICVTHRYIHDLLPFLILTSAFGIHAILALTSKALRRGILMALAPLALASVYINCACALYYQSDQIWGVDESCRSRLRELWGTAQSTIDFYSKDGHAVHAWYRLWHPSCGPDLMENTIRDPRLDVNLITASDGQWNTLICNREAARLGSAWRVAHPFGTVVPPPFQCMGIYPFCSGREPVRHDLLSFHVQAGHRYLVSMRIRSEDFHGRIVFSGNHLRACADLPAVTDSAVYDIPLWVQDSTTKEVVVALEAEAGQRSDAASVDVYPCNLSEYEPWNLPVEVASMDPFAAIVHAEQACSLETPLQFVPGYEATVDGTAANVVMSPVGKVMVAVPRGQSTVQLRFVGTPATRLSLSMFALGSVLVLGYGMIAAMKKLRGRSNGARSLA